MCNLNSEYIEQKTALFMNLLFNLSCAGHQKRDDIEKTNIRNGRVKSVDWQSCIIDIWSKIYVTIVFKGDINILLLGKNLFVFNTLREYRNIKYKLWTYQ